MMSTIRNSALRLSAPRLAFRNIHFLICFYLKSLSIKNKVQFLQIQTPIIAALLDTQQIFSPQFTVSLYFIRKVENATSLKHPRIVKSFMKSLLSCRGATNIKKNQLCLPEQYQKLCTSTPPLTSTTPVRYFSCLCFYISQKCVSKICCYKSKKK